jgi:hypothetical protein
MGLRCSCGVRTNPVSIAPNITMNFVDGGLRDGTLTIAANACVDRLESSTFSATFVDQSGMTPNRSFVFTSTSVTNVICSPTSVDCIGSILGMGLVTGELTPREFSVTFQNRTLPFSDRLLVISIDGFVSNFTNADLTPDLTFFGCTPIS